MGVHKLRLGFRLLQLCFIGLLFINLSYDVPITGDRDAMLDRQLGWRVFGIVGWMARANLQKLGQQLTESEAGMTDQARSAFVRDTLAVVQRQQSLDDQMKQAFVRNPNAREATAALRAQRDELQATLDARMPITEAIIQQQIESVLRDNGFAFGGQVLPPNRFKFTGLPDVMIISRRDKIQRIDQRILEPNLAVDEQDRIERETDRQFGVSSFVTAIGGLGAYPTMLPETPALPFAISVATHEWLHNYLVWRLAWVAVNYTSNPLAQTINETTAVITEREIAPKVLARYYPDLPAAEREGRGAGVASPAGQTAFDFRKEMRETRVRADELLDAGRIGEAEQYMETRRGLFVKNGYAIRKLNQAYFAFYGAYNADAGGSPASGRDPIGPAVQALRARSATLHEFVDRIAVVRTLEDLQR